MLFIIRHYITSNSISTAELQTIGNIFVILQLEQAHTVQDIFYMEKQEWESREELYNTPANRRLKYISFIMISVAIVIFLAQMIWHDAIPTTLNLFMRGCAGLCALVFVILVAIIVYRAERSFINQK